MATGIKIDEKTKKRIREVYEKEDHPTIRYLSRRFGLHDSTIRRIIKSKP